ncbi:LysR family transcriptional regulator [Aeromonas sp. MdU4]|uniref:LysR family transcriptional regulator n=1 Tax=Aeromonas sp. MdU4 TaxID=3342819 RepID=UPI0035BA6B2B
MSQVDLNLFRVLDTVIRYGGVTTAAEMMEMTPSAISQAISRLTALVGEPLFVRQGRGIIPTARALSLHREIMVPLHDIERSLQRTDLFDPQTSRRTFRIAGVPDIDLFFLPELNNLLQTKAPNCQLEWNTQVQDEALRQNSLYLHSVDLVLAIKPMTEPGIENVKLMSQALRIACRKDHPRIRQAPDMNAFFSEKHVVLQARRLDNLLLNTLTKSPLPPRQIAYESDSLLSALHLVSRTDLLCVASQWHMDMLGPSLQLASYPLPWPSEDGSVYMSWHKSANQDAGLNWFKQQVQAVSLL